MAEDYSEQLKRIKTEKVQSAIVAVDYLNNDMLPHIKKLLEDTFTDYETRGFLPFYENPTRILIDRSAKTYKEAPKRVVFDGETESEVQTLKYNELLQSASINSKAQDTDKKARLLTAAVLLVQVASPEQLPAGMTEDVITLDVLSRDNCDVILHPMTGDIEELVYSSGRVGQHNGQVYHIWTNDKIVDIEVSKDGKHLVGSIPNPYGFIPAAILYDTEIQYGRLWRYSSWDQLITASDGINLFNSEAMFNAKQGMAGQPITNMSLAEGVVLGSDAPLLLDDTGGATTPFFEYRTNTINLPQFMEWLNGYKEQLADEYGVNLKIAGTGSAESGFKLVVEEFENLELRGSRIISAKQFEKDLFQVFARMSEAVHNWGLSTDSEMFADFVEPKLPVNKVEEWNIAERKIASGVMTKEMYWLEQDPDLTPEDIAQRKRDIAQAQGQAGIAPTFEGV